MSTNENGILPTIVTITSLMETTYRCSYEFYILVDDASKPNYSKIKSLEARYNRLRVNFLEPPQCLNAIAKLLKNTQRWPIAAYYRLFLPDLLPYFSRIIYVDYDIIILGDLDEMFHLDLKGYNLKAIIDPNPNWNNHIFMHPKYICSGVLLMNLKQMRQNGMTEKYLQYLKTNYSLINIADQTVFNNVDWELTGFLPPKYGVLYYGINAQQYYNGLRYKAYTVEQIDDAMNHPIIAHIISKPFKGYNNFKVSRMWWNFAMLTHFSSEIKAKYSKVFLQYYKAYNISEENAQKFKSRIGMENPFE